MDNKISLKVKSLNLLIFLILCLPVVPFIIIISGSLIYLVGGAGELWAFILSLAYAYCIWLFYYHNEGSDKPFTKGLMLFGRNILGLAFLTGLVIAIGFLIGLIAGSKSALSWALAFYIIIIGIAAIAFIISLFLRLNACSTPAEILLGFRKSYLENGELQYQKYEDKARKKRLFISAGAIWAAVIILHIAAYLYFNIIAMSQAGALKSKIAKLEMDPNPAAYYAGKGPDIRQALANLKLVTTGLPDQRFDFQEKVALGDVEIWDKIYKIVNDNKREVEGIRPLLKNGAISFDSLKAYEYPREFAKLRDLQSVLVLNIYKYAKQNDQNMVLLYARDIDRIMRIYADFPYSNILNDYISRSYGLWEALEYNRLKNGKDVRTRILSESTVDMKSYLGRASRYNMSMILKDLENGYYPKPSGLGNRIFTWIYYPIWAKYNINQVMARLLEINDNLINSKSAVRRQPPEKYCSHGAYGIIGEYYQNKYFDKLVELTEQYIKRNIFGHENPQNVNKMRS